jgi:hypothetical protein
MSILWVFIHPVSGVKLNTNYPCHESGPPLVSSPWSLCRESWHKRRVSGTDSSNLQNQESNMDNGVSNHPELCSCHIWAHFLPYTRKFKSVRSTVKSGMEFPRDWIRTTRDKVSKSVTENRSSYGRYLIWLRKPVGVQMFSSRNQPFTIVTRCSPHTSSLRSVISSTRLDHYGETKGNFQISRNLPTPSPCHSSPDPCWVLNLDTLLLQC